MRQSKRGFTLIELMVAMIAALIVLLGMGSVLFLMFGGMIESRQFLNSTSAIDLTRELTFDARPADRLFFPATNGATGEYGDGSLKGHQVVFRTSYYNPTTNVTQRAWVRWRSEITGSETDGRFLVRRYVQWHGNDVPDANWGTPTFTEIGFTRFDVRRVSASTFSVEMRNEGSKEAAHTIFSPAMRNAR
jgi:prepilin-type N-terminal cleavage/methylation domain-containing protein